MLGTRRLLTRQPRHPARADARESALLLQVVGEGAKGLAEALLTAPRHPARAAAQGNAAVRRAVLRRDRPMCRLLVEHGADERFMPHRVAPDEYGLESSDDELWF